MTITVEHIEALRAENTTLKQKQRHLEKQLEQYQQAYERLQHQVNELLRYRFGQRSERDVDPEHPQIDFLTNPSKQESNNTTVDSVVVSEHQRRKRVKKDTSQFPRIIEIIPVEQSDRQCACGREKRVIRYETKELYDYIPAVFRIIEQRREVVACPNGCASLCTAPLPLQVLPKTKASESLLAHIVVSKFHDRQPLYHLEKYGRAVEVSRETMARWMIQLVTPLQPLFNLMKDIVLEYDISSIDATTLQVLREPGRKPQIGSYVYCLRGGSPTQSVVLYGYCAQEHGAFVDQWLEGFQGCIHMDADSNFNQLLSDPAVLPSHCNAHARRYFERVKKQSKKQGLAHEALRYYKKLYRIEREAKENQLTAEQRYHVRQSKSKPILQTFNTWLDEHAPLVLPESPLGKAFQYAIKHRKGLSRFLEDGRLEIDNNETEQEIKPLVIARKNFMFATSVDGAHAVSMHMSLIRTALAHGLDPYQYYVAILKKIPQCKAVEDYEALLPWNITLK